MKTFPWTECVGLCALILLVAAAALHPEETPLYRDRSQPVKRRVADLLSRMTLEEKVGQMNWPCVYVNELGRTVEEKMNACREFAAGSHLPGLGPGGGFFTLANEILHRGPVQQAEYFNRLQRIAVERTRLGIPLAQVEEGTHGLMCSGGTIFPEGPGLGSTWDTDLLREVYAAAAREARAVGIHMLFTLVVEPNRDPRLGRNQEGYSECPFLCSRIAEAIVEGCQGWDISDPDRVVAGLCHYPGQSQPVSGMEQGAMEISERMLREVFLPPWEAGIAGRGALGVMATYPAVDGIPVHGSRFLLTDLLRGELGFRGVVLSEGNGFQTLITRNVVPGQKEAGAAALRAGVDVNITYEDAYMLPLIDNVREGEVSMEDIDRAVERILRLKYELGLFDDPFTDPAEAEKVVRNEAHRELALRAAREGIVLLKNEDGLLPLDPGLRRVAVIGPNADDERNLLGDYTSNVITQDIITVLEGIRAVVSPSTEVVHVRGCGVLPGGPDEIGKARAVAAEADVAVVVVGENERFKPGGLGTDGEHKDVASLDLTGRQQELIREVHATGTPTVVVLVNGRPLSVRWCAANVPAIVEAWLPGESGGQAVAEVLFGRVNPCGRLPVTVPRHSGQLPAYYDYKPSKAFSLRRTGYVDMKAAPLWEFGHGLSYTSFEYSGLRIEPEALASAGTVRVSCTVRNAGGRAGAEVAQLYLDDKLSSVVTPVRVLRGFGKVFLEPGESREVTFELGPGHMSLLDERLEPVVEPGEFEVMIGASCEDIRLRGNFTVTE